MKKNKKVEFVWNVLVNVCRYVLSATFIFSGFTKAVDPHGMSYKLESYFQYFGLEKFLVSPYPIFFADIIAVFEFSLGIFLLLGARRKICSAVVFVVMLFLTTLTAYIYRYNPISDCGCFGDILVLSNALTFWKNFVLLLMATVLLFCQTRIWRLISEQHQWIMIYYSITFILVLCIYSAHYLPIIDVGKYREGTNLLEATRSEFETTFLYEKDGDTIKVDINHIPTDTTWQYVSTTTKLLKSASITNFFIVDYNGNDCTDSILKKWKRLFVITCPYMDDAEDGVTDRLNDLADFCEDYNYGLICLTGSDSMSVERWKDRTGATYPVLFADASMLREFVRSNPGLVLLQSGDIIKKWSCNNLPDENYFLSEFKNLKSGVFHADTISSQLLKIILWFVVPLLLVIMIDQAWHKRNKRKNKIINNPFNLNNMRKKIVAGNWKMNKNLQEGIELAKELNTVLSADKPNCGVIICTPFIHLASVASIVDPTIIGLGAENCADKVSGAYTGEVSAEMVKSTGANYVILGHSERRAYYHETAEILKEKVKLALANDLKVIFCIGEVLEERESGKQNEVVKAQLEGSLFDLTPAEFANIILAYEPVWAIGTGKTATADQAQDMHAFIRKTVAEKFGAEVAENVTILYGGSCKPSNAKELFAKNDVDGGLIGGASLKAADFKGIIDAWK